MFVTSTRTLVVEAFGNALKSDYHPTLAGRNIWVGREFPADNTNYPGVWVDFTPNGAVQSAGIGHIEHRFDSQQRPVIGSRWVYSGTVTATVVSLTSLDRDTLIDELLRMVAFGNEHPELEVFRGYIEGNDLINLDVQWDKATLSAFMDSNGTPWGSDDTVYEVTLSLVCRGEFISTLEGKIPTGILEAIEVYPTAEPSGDVDPNPDLPNAWQ